MASHALQPPIAARVDRAGRLIAADPPVLALQEQAGARIDAPLAIPQLAAVARLAARLGVAIERPVLAASEDEDLDLWVRAEPDADGVTLTFERWIARPPLPSRWAGTGEGAPAAAPAAAEDLLTDPDLNVLLISPGLARRIGPAAAAAIGKPLARLLRPIEDDDGNLPLLTAVSGRAAFAGQPAALRGTEETVMLDGDPRFEDGRFLGYAIRVSAPGAEPRGLAALPLDHLLKEPLAAIIDQAEEIAGRSTGPLRSDYAGYGTDIAAAARHLLDLLASISPGHVGAEGESVGDTLDLAELVLDAAGLVQAQASARGVVLDIGGEGRLAARGQGRAVTQILVNLIGNAARFSPSGASVAIILESGPQATVTVSDLGPGVAPADRVRIFEKFEQAEANSGGAGLGLAISRRLARDMGGEVELLDTPSGAAFRLRLPKP